MRTARELALTVAVALLLGTPAARAECRLQVYGTYSLGGKHGASVRDRARELLALGGNFVMATGDTRKPLDDLPAGLQAAPGCTLLQPRDWQDGPGEWSEAKAAGRLAEMAARFDHDPRVGGICLSHEVEEFADHARRVWMYRLAKRFFRTKRVFFYYAGVPRDYGTDGEVESDVFFVALAPFTATGDYDRDKVVGTLERALAAVDRTPGIPLWMQTSINADQKYVSGPETMVRTWGPAGERMTTHLETILSRKSPRGTGVTGFFWRSFGRFDWDLGYPPFGAHRERVQQIARRWSCGAGDHLRTAATP